MNLLRSLSTVHFLGLAEVLHALGQERLDKLMPDVIETTMKTDLSPSVRDGYLMLYIYLPATFGDDFLDYIGRIIPSILKVRMFSYVKFYRENSTFQNVLKSIPFHVECHNL